MLGLKNRKRRGKHRKISVVFHVKLSNFLIEIQQKQKEMEMNVEFIRKNKKVLTKEFVDSSHLQQKENTTILNREVFDQENDILQKLAARKNRAVSLPHQKFHFKGS